MMSLTPIATPILQNDASYKEKASTPNTITKGKNIPERRAVEKEQDSCTGIIKAEGAAEAGLGYATALSGWRRWYPL